MLVGPRIFWAPGQAVGPGCYVPVGGTATPPGSSGALHAGGGGGFAALEAGCWRVVDVSEPHVVQFPRLVVVRPRRGAVCSPKCRPIGQKTPKIGHCEAMGLHFGGFGVNRGVLLAREPLNMRVNPLIRTSTPRCAPGRRCLRAGHRVYVRVRAPTCG